jgi:hypothetical protein
MCTRVGGLEHVNPIAGGRIVGRATMVARVIGFIGEPRRPPRAPGPYIAMESGPGSVRSPCVSEDR